MGGLCAGGRFAGSGLSQAWLCPGYGAFLTVTVASRFEYLFNFDNAFEIHDDIEVLKRMGMACGLESGSCSRGPEGGQELGAEGAGALCDRPVAWGGHLPAGGAEAREAAEGARRFRGVVLPVGFAAERVSGVCPAAPPPRPSWGSWQRRALW